MNESKNIYILHARVQYFSLGGWGWQYSLRPYQLLLYGSCMGFHVRYANIGIKHDFLCINICGAET